MRRLPRSLRLAFWLAALAGVAAAAARLQQRLAAPPRLGAAPPPEPEASPPTPASTAPPAPPAPSARQDLAEIRGIGPVYRDRLAKAGITRFAALAAARPETVAAATGVPEERAADWIAQAAGREAL